MNDPFLNTFFTAIPIAKILCTVMEGTYKNPDYEKYLKEQKEIEENRCFNEMYRGGS